MEVGGALAAAAAAGATYYFYGDKKAKKHRQAASKWAKGMKQEVLREAKKLNKIDKKDLARIVDKAAAVYAGARAIDKKDLQAAASELKRNWEEVKREVSGGVKKVTKKTAPKKAAKKTVKKAVKKAPKKVAKKKTTKSSR